jgi:hypothetical protein
MYDIPDIKKRLADAGLPESVISLFSDADLVENARAMGLLDKKPETPSAAQSETLPDVKSAEPPPAKAAEHPEAKGKKKKGG